MMENKSHEVLEERALDIILNFKSADDVEKVVANEILRLRDDIKKVVELLPEKEREIVELRYFHSLPIDRISEKLGEPKEEILQILLSGIEKIKDNIKSKDNLAYAQRVAGFRQFEKPPPVGVSPFAVGFVIGVVLVCLFVATYFVLQKQFLDQIPSLSQVVNTASNFFQEQLFDNESLRQFTQSKSNQRVQLTTSPNNIKISGSTSLLALSRRWENTFSKDFSAYQIDLVSSDSNSGISALIGGKVDIANSSRPVTFLDQEEAAKMDLQLAEYRVALDALVIIVNKKNPLSELSLDDLQGIFSGEIKSWKSLGKEQYRQISAPVITVVREKGSGTNDFAIGRILQGDDFPSSVTRKNSNKEILELVATNEGAVSFVNSTNYPWENKDIKYLKVKSYENSQGVSPFEGIKLNEQTIRYGDYPLAHYLYLITTVPQPKEVQEFLDWVLNLEGQKIVRQSGLIPVVED